MTLSANPNAVHDLKYDEEREEEREHDIEHEVSFLSIAVLGGRFRSAAVRMKLSTRLRKG